MKNLENLTEALAKNRSLFDKYGVQLIGVFGSYIRGEENSDSDLDILIDSDESNTFSLFDLMDLEDELNELLGIKVDLAMRRSLKPRIGQHILRELVTV